MASGMFNRAVKEILDRTLDITTGCKIMLVTSAYTYDPDTDFVDAGGGSDILDAEISVSGYTGAWGGSGRKSATITFEEQDANNRAVIKIANLTWTALGTGATIAAAVLIKEGGSDDTTSKAIAYFDLTDTPTNGGDVTLSFDATNGNIRVAN